MTVNRLHEPTPLQRQHSILAGKLIAAVEGVEKAALYSRVEKSALSDYERPNVRRYMPSDVIEELEARAGRPVFTEHLANSLGFLLVPMPEAGAVPWGQGLKELSKDFGEVSSTICEIIGGDASASEMRALVTECDRLGDIVAAIRAHAVQAMGEGG